MEFIELHSPARVSGEHVLVIAHSSTALTRGLDHGEPVVLQTDKGELYAAEVIDIGFWPEDTVYTLALGARLPENLARERIAGLDPAQHDLALHEIVDLLGELARPQDPDKRG
ncbi:MAG TPA: hypothetical protein VD864_07015 [Nocardioides sp.]|nr:hypothetical protein [Nocardioides sp.]